MTSRLTGIHRLNWQHYYLLKVTGGILIHPSVPTKNLRDIVDIGTGTGWVAVFKQSMTFKEFDVVIKV